MEYSGWKQINKVKIVYSTQENWHDVEFNGKKYKKAYIVESGTTNTCQKSLASAIHWAESYDWSDGKKGNYLEPTIVETDNRDFSFQIISAADNSWSQGGKLSFWMCLMEKSGIEPFAVGINSDLLADLILESTVYKGAVKEKVFFARKNGQLGVLHEAMPSYQTLLKDQQLKKNITKGKTSKWKIGYEYNTLTQSDTMFGYFAKVADLTYTRLKTNSFYSYDDALLLKLDFSAEHKPFFTSVHDGDWKKHAPSFHWSCRRLPDKCPARQEGKKVFEETADHYNVFSKALLDDFMKSKEDNFKYHSVDEWAFALFTHTPDVTIKILETVRDLYSQTIYNIEHNIKDNFNRYQYDLKDDTRDMARTKYFNVDYLLYKNSDKLARIEYDGKIETFTKDIVGYYNRLIEIAKIEKEKINGSNSK